MRWCGVFLLLCGLASALPAAGGEIVLAEGGKTPFEVVAAAGARSDEKAAAADLAAVLNEITGADFSASPEKTKRILVGVRPECDTEPLKEDERRVTTHDGELYLYGGGEYGNVNAVYDFLRDELGCRWYNVTGDQRIPRRGKLVIGELKKSLVPSIPYMTSDRVGRYPAWKTFSRRHGLVDLFATNISTYGAHAGQRIIPSGLVPFGGPHGVTNTPPPLELFKDKKYLETNPEFFAVDAKGRRWAGAQLCYSNLAMRDEFERNIELLLKAEKYSGGRKILGIGQDDNAGKFCYCPECEALEKKYDHPAGPYFDFLLDMSKRFEKKHPKLLLCFLAYHATLEPPKCFTKLPANLLPSYAPLGCDFSKPLTHRVNAEQLRNFERWARLVPRMHWWSYPTTYPRPIMSYPLVANIHRIAENFRLAHKLKVWLAYDQFGYGPYHNFGFNDLRLYLLCELCRRIDADEQAIIREYTDACYGKAAPMLRKYLAELEKLELASPRYLRWNPDILISEYATGANLLRWERDFDAMMKLASGDPRHVLNVRRARFVLDQMLLAKWPYLSDAERAKAGDLEALISRLDKIIAEDAADLRKSIRESDPERFRRDVAGSCRWIHKGLDQYVARARGGKPLPSNFARHKTLYRILPNRNREALDEDPEAPFGLCTVWRCVKAPSWFCLRSFDHRRQPQWQREQLPKPFSPGRIAKTPADGKYHYYHLGSITITPDCQIGCLNSVSGFSLSHLYDPKRPNRLFDVHAAVAVMPGRKQMKFGEIVVIPGKRDAAPNPKRKAVKDTSNSFI